uniref:Uncharacterized protein n=1 Tax=Amphimedon queenslandica TaxID=400682 RepID=I1F2D9_AMPQE
HLFSFSFWLAMFPWSGLWCFFLSSLLTLFSLPVTVKFK